MKNTRTLLVSLILTFTLVMASLMVGSVSAQSSTSVARVQPGNTTALSTASGNSKRISVTIQNVGSVNVGLGTVSTVTYATGIVLAPSQQMVCSGDTSAWYSIAQSGTGDLRVVTLETSGPRPTAALPSCSISRLSTSGIANTAAANTVPMSDGSNVVPGNVIIKLLTSAITANSTSCSDASGSLAITSNATGLGTIFRCDGSTYQLLAKYSDDDAGSSLGTIATTGNTDDYVIAPFAGTLTGVDFSGVDALATSDTNYVTFTITNLGQAGGGSTAMLAASDANTTKTTGGSAIAANTKRSLTIHGTGANLIVAKGDRLRVRAAATGTLANTVTFSKMRFYFNRLS